MSVSIPPENLMQGIDAAIPTDPVCRFSVEQYHRMFEAGILTDEAPLELLDGWLVPKMIKNPIYSRPSGTAEQPDYAEREDFGPAQEVRLIVAGRHVAMLPVRSLLP